MNTCRLGRDRERKIQREIVTVSPETFAFPTFGLREISAASYGDTGLIQGLGRSKVSLEGPAIGLVKVGCLT